MLVINPTAGKETALAYEKDLTRALMAHFDQVTVRYTKKAGDASLLALEADRMGCDCYYVVGGDGTLNEAVNGLAQLAKPLVFGFLPMGTVNDLARVLSIPLAPDQAIASLADFETRPLDIGRVNDQYFVNVIAIGAIPQAVVNTSIADKSKYGFLAYVKDGINGFLNSRPVDFYLQIDNFDRRLHTAMIIITLTNSVGSFENMVKEARPDDGKLHLLSLEHDNLFRVSPDIIPQFFRGSLSDVEGLTYHQAKKIVIEADQAYEANVDGDPGPSLPLEIEVLPSFLQVIMPKGQGHI
ncbi:diacylglycerol/lipid kinase family protein [Aerococcus urinaehominis]|nr:diacylglycerol kinase family protein [Aerococcus urinaehominis]